MTLFLPPAKWMTLESALTLAPREVAAVLSVSIYLSPCGFLPVVTSFPRIYQKQLQTMKKNSSTNPVLGYLV